MNKRSVFYNDETFSQFFHLHYAPLVLFTYRMTGNQASAEDIVEEAFIKLWKKRDTLTEVRSLKSYLYTMAKNGAVSWLRSRKKEADRLLNSPHQADEFEQSAIDAMIYSETMAKVYAAMDQLPGQCRKVFILLYLEGKTISEISRQLRIAETTARTHHLRGLVILRKMFLCIFLFIITSGL